MQHIINPVYYQDFILSGKPEFTLKSMKTGNEEIFVVRRARYDNFFWVNNRLREYIGKLIFVNGANENIWDFQRADDLFPKYREAQIITFSWLWRQLLIGPLYSKLYQAQIINHTGRCGHCHRPLTHPESIPIGIGPDCFKKLSLIHKPLITLP